MTGGGKGRESDAAERAFQPEPILRMADRVANQVREYIISQDLEEGARLPSERRLAELVGSSRPTVSQALRSLAIIGLIEIRPGAGAFVRRRPGSFVETGLDLMMSLEPDSMNEMVELRRMLEDSAFKVIRATPEDELDLTALKTAIDTFAKAQRGASEWMAMDTQFHVEFVRLAKNRYLTSMFASAHAAVVRKAYQRWIDDNEVPTWLRGDGLETQIEMHRAIVRALIAGDFEALDRALDHHQAALVAHMAELQPARRK